MSAFALLSGTGRHEATRAAGGGRGTLAGFSRDGLLLVRDYADAPDAPASLLQHADRTLVEVGCEVVEADKPQRRLRRRPTRSFTSKQDERRPATAGLSEQRTEVRVGRYEHPAVVRSPIEDREVVSAEPISASREALVEASSGRSRSVADSRGDEAPSWFRVCQPAHPHRRWREPLLVAVVPLITDAHPAASSIPLTRWTIVASPTTDPPQPDQNWTGPDLSMLEWVEQSGERCAIVDRDQWPLTSGERLTPRIVLDGQAVTRRPLHPHEHDCSDVFTMRALLNL